VNAAPSCHAGVVRRVVRIVAWSSLPVAGLAVALGLATSGAAAPSRSVPVNALIVGKVLGCGGFNSPSGACSLDHDAVVSAFSSRHQLVAREKITNGHFAFLVRPGSYTLALPCSCKPRQVTAKAGRTVHANVSFRAR
jgi:hypothetical protein